MDEMDRERGRRQRDGNPPPRRRRVPSEDYNAPHSRNLPPDEHVAPSRRRYQPSFDEEEDEYEYEPRPRRRPRRRRSFFPAFLAGCATCIIFLVLAAAIFVFYTLRIAPGRQIGGIAGLGGPHTYTHSDTQSFLLSSLSQLQVCDKIGNVKVSIDPQASQASIVTQKIVQSASQDEATQAFKSIAVEVQPPGVIQHPLACARYATPPGATPAAGTPAPGTAGTQGNALTVNITIPNTGGMLPSTNNAVDVTIVLPASALPQNGPTLLLTIESSVGNITVDGLSGRFNIKGSTGDVSIKHAYLTPGSDIETGQGNITFAGRLVTPEATDQQNLANFKLSSEKGNLDVTLPDTTNITLDTNTNAGTIKSDFNLQVHVDGEAANYHGPLNAAAGTPAATLVLDVSLGNVTIHKEQTPS